MRPLPIWMRITVLAFVGVALCLRGPSSTAQTEHPLLLTLTNRSFDDFTRGSALNLMLETPPVPDTLPDTLERLTLDPTESPELRLKAFQAWTAVTPDSDEIPAAIKALLSPPPPALPSPPSLARAILEALPARPSADSDPPPALIALIADARQPTALRLRAAELLASGTPGSAGQVRDQWMELLTSNTTPAEIRQRLLLLLIATANAGGSDSVHGPLISILADPGAPPSLRTAVGTQLLNQPPSDSSSLQQVASVVRDSTTPMPLRRLGATLLVQTRDQWSDALRTALIDFIQRAGESPDLRAQIAIALSEPIRADIDPARLRQIAFDRTEPLPIRQWAAHQLAAAAQHLPQPTAELISVIVDRDAPTSLRLLALDSLESRNLLLTTPLQDGLLRVLRQPDANPQLRSRTLMLFESAAIRSFPQPASVSGEELATTLANIQALQAQVADTAPDSSLHRQLEELARTYDSERQARTEAVPGSTTATAITGVVVLAFYGVGLKLYWNRRARTDPAGYLTALFKLQRRSLPGVGIDHLLLAGGPSRHQAVWDAWIRQQTTQATEAVQAQTGAEFPPPPCQVDDDAPEPFSPKLIHRLFSSDTHVWIITGPAGSGKTVWLTQGCQHLRSSALPTRSPALVIALSEADFDGLQNLPASLGTALWQRLLSARLPQIHGSRPAAEWLVRSGKLIIAIDGISEWSEAARSALDPLVEQSPYVRFVMTTRDGASTIAKRPKATTIQVLPYPTREFARALQSILARPPVNAKTADDSAKFTTRAIAGAEDLARLTGDRPLPAEALGLYGSWLKSSTDSVSLSNTRKPPHLAFVIREHLVASFTEAGIPQDAAALQSAAIQKAAWQSAVEGTSHLPAIAEDGIPESTLPPWVVETASSENADSGDSDSGDHPTVPRFRSPFIQAYLAAGYWIPSWASGDANPAKKATQAPRIPEAWRAHPDCVEQQLAFALCEWAASSSTIAEETAETDSLNEEALSETVADLNDILSRRSDDIPEFLRRLRLSRALERLRSDNDLQREDCIRELVESAQGDAQATRLMMDLAKADETDPEIRQAAVEILARQPIDAGEPFDNLLALLLDSEAPMHLRYRIVERWRHSAPLPDALREKLANALDERVDAQTTSFIDSLLPQLLSTTADES